MKLLEETMHKTLFDINYNTIFFNLSPRIMKIKAKIKIYDLLKLKGFFTKETINKMKRQSTDWEKIFGNDVTDKGLVSKICTQIIMLNRIKTNNPLKNE